MPRRGHSVVGQLCPWWLKVLGESATKLATQWAYNVLLNRFVIAFVIRETALLSAQRDERCFGFFFFCARFELASGNNFAQCLTFFKKHLFPLFLSE